MEENKYPEYFDPTKDEGFLKNLEKVLEPSAYENEAIDIDTGDQNTSILTITEDDKEEEALPQIDTSDIYMDEVPMEKEVDDDVIENISNQLASQVGMECEILEELKQKEMPAVKKPAWLMPALITAGVFVIGLFILFLSKPGRNFLISHGIGRLFASHTTYIPEEGGKVARGILFLLPPFAEHLPGEELPELTVTPEPSITEPPKEPEKQEILHHFLVLGMDEAGEDKEACSDLILMVTINASSGEVKLTTILRDLFVFMPGAGEDKICLAYTKGGIGLVYDTIEQSLGIRPDGYLLFSYEKFRSFIDAVGGVVLNLTAKEADYLNKTNYISQPENRVMVNGENHLNGDQALGYCRIRHVGTAQNEYNDIGRTARCKNLIMALYEQNRSRSKTELFRILTEGFKMLTTDITGKDCSDYLSLFLAMPAVTFSSYRIPAEGSYTTSIIRGQAALVADLGQNRTLWQEFLFPKIPSKEELEVPSTQP